ncbi:MAG: hypothetical protein IBX47_07060, partial [Desulfuromonadales bacterium]|nr:hypothetical protein [Desulfuromonadales bacterium]
MDVFFQQEDAVAFFLFIMTLIALLLLFLFPYLVWRISTRLKQNGDRLQEISNRLENMLAVLAPHSTHSADMTPLAESSDEQTPFNFDADDEDTSIAEIEPFSAVPFDA